MHDKKLYGTATVGAKGQVVIPANAREELQIQAGDRLYVVGSERGKFVGFIKEEQLREVVDSLIENADQLRMLLPDEQRG